MKSSDEQQLDLLAKIVCPSCNGEGIERTEILAARIHGPISTVKRCTECKGRGFTYAADAILDGGL